jgi:formylmethanofuran dehydrogenase subunit E
MPQTRPENEGVAPGKSTDIVVFMVRRETKCAECGKELFDGNLLRMEDNRPLCLDCADLGHLEFLTSGNTALTRRATKHSPLRAVVVR